MKKLISLLLEREYDRIRTSEEVDFIKNNYDIQAYRKTYDEAYNALMRIANNNEEIKELIEILEDNLILEAAQLQRFYLKKGIELGITDLNTLSAEELE